jgi:hypothetical protein
MITQMSVPPEVRAAELEIDKSIERLVVWQANRSRLIRELLDYSRDAIEVVHLMASYAASTRSRTRLEAALAVERDVQAGVFNALKWAFTFDSGEGAIASPPEDALHELVGIGTAYEVLVDALKLAAHDKLTIRADMRKRILTIFEGGDRTGADARLVSSLRSTAPFYMHTPFTKDEDRLTRRWTAGQFRSAATWIGEIAARAETCLYRRTATGHMPALARPTVLKVPDAEDGNLRGVIDDLTLDLGKVQQSRWMYTCWMDTPLVGIDGERFGLSSMLKTIAGAAREDQMLRTAALMDSDQYSKVSGLRESRMLDASEKALQSRGWAVQTRLRHPGPPPREIDVLAKRGDLTLVIQLKSSIRPISPWEVSKRNDDVFKGITHTAEILKRFPEPRLGLVLTDGYRGDYATWEASLRTGIPLVAWEKLEDLAADPHACVRQVKEELGLTGERQTEPIEPREAALLGWTLRLYDRPASDD